MTNINNAVVVFIVSQVAASGRSYTQCCGIYLYQRPRVVRDKRTGDASGVKIVSSHAHLRTEAQASCLDASVRRLHFKRRGAPRRDCEGEWRVVARHRYLRVVENFAKRRWRLRFRGRAHSMYYFQNTQGKFVILISGYT